jgi:aminocarboxymuconate-semialdehyde decarboxylase
MPTLPSAPADPAETAVLPKAAHAVVDSHVHALPAALLQELCARPSGINGVTAIKVDGGWQVTLPGSTLSKLVRPLMAAAQRRAERARDLELTGQIISPWLDAQPTAGMSHPQARDWAHRLNSALGEEAGTEPGSAVLATIPVTPSIDEDVQRAIEAEGLAGVVMSTNPAGAADLADPLLEPLWEAAAGLGAPVVLHPPTDGPARALPDSAEFGNTLCRLVDTTFAVTKLLLSGVLDRHPRLKLVIVHGGGFLPYQAMRVDGGHRADALAHYEIERDRPSDYLRDLWFDTVALQPASIRFLVDAVGADRVLLGSDYPFPLGDATPVETVRRAGLGDLETAAVLGGNAHDLFHLTDGIAHV